MAKFNIKKNDTVIVLAGEDKGKTGKVLKVMTDKQRALVEGVWLSSARVRRSFVSLKSQGRRLSNGKYSTVKGRV